MTKRRKRPPKRGWRHLVPRWYWLILTPLFLIIIGVGLFIYGYLTTSIPSLNAEILAQQSKITYSDGKSVITTIGTNRTPVELSKVPTSMQAAVIAAEDRTFFTNPGISPTGILRATVVNLSGGSTQGGSTITQQYAKKAFLSDERTFTRKFSELFVAIKLDRTMSKKQILQDYLNAVYYGRGAYGVEAASQAYFGVDVQKLTVSQSALLASVINAPSLFDPDISSAAKARAEKRWAWVIDGMKTIGAITPEQAADASFPKTRTIASTLHNVSGPNGYLIDQVKADVERHGLDWEKVATGGNTIVTTIDAGMQKAAIDNETKYFGAFAQPSSALVAIEPGTGAVRALYGGRDYSTSQFDLATAGARQAGSAFKPFALAAYLESGGQLTDSFAAPGTIDFDCHGQPAQVKNDSGESYGRINLVSATAQSVNTVYVALSLGLDPDQDASLGKVAAMASAAGITTGLSEGDSQATGDPTYACTLALGVKDVHPIDMADAYATFAADGVHADPYVVASIAGRDADYEAKPATKRVMTSETAQGVTTALQAVISSGTASNGALAGGRPAAGKTGTTDDNTNAWFVGYTPQLATAVWMGDSDGNVPMSAVPGFGQVSGHTVPVPLWRDFMNAALANQPIVPLNGESMPPRVTEQVPTTTAPATTTSAPSSSAPPTTMSPSPMAPASPTPTRAPIPSPTPPAPTTPPPPPTQAPTQGPTSPVPANPVPTDAPVSAAQVQPSADATPAG